LLYIVLYYVKILIDTYNLYFVGSYKSSHRNIEPELLRIILTNKCLDEIVSHAENNDRLLDSLTILKGRISGGSMAIPDEFESQDLLQFYNLRNIIKQGEAFGFEPFPGTFLDPKLENAVLPPDIQDLLIEFYNAAELGYCFTKPGVITGIDQIPVFPGVIQYGRLKLGSEIFGSTFSARHIKSSRILARFVALEDESIDSYPGQVQFYFDHTIYLPSGEQTYHLAFVRWYRPAKNDETRFHMKIKGDNLSCNVELWEQEFYDLGRDCIIPIHQIYSRFIAGTYTIDIKLNQKTYMTVIPLHRKYNL